MNKNHVNKLHR